MPIPDLRIARAVVFADARGVRVAAATDGFDAAEAERLAVLFGLPPAGAACPVAHFAYPFGPRHVAVVRVEGRPHAALGFRFLVLAADLYRHLGDPFAVSDRFPVSWTDTGTLPPLEWPPEPLPPRTVGDLQELLKSCDPAADEMALLLGAAQVLVDGGTVLLQRPGPDERLLRRLWQLLPNKARAELWPASVVYAPDLRFDAAVTPDPTGPRHTEDGLKDYPRGNYEHRLQAAVEAGDQRELDALLARRTGGDTLRLGLTIIAVAVAGAAAVKFLL